MKAVEKARAEAAAEGKELSRIEESKIRAKANVSQSKESEEHVTEAEAAKALGIKHKVFGYSTQELQKKADGEKVFPHVFGTDDQGRDIMVRVMVGTRISIIVGVCAAIIVLIIGALYGSVSGYCGGAVDTVMQRIVEIIYSIPEMLIILLLSATLKPALEQFQNSGDGPMQNLVNDSRTKPDLHVYRIRFIILGNHEPNHPWTDPSVKTAGVCDSGPCPWRKRRTYH